MEVEDTLGSALGHTQYPFVALDVIVLVNRSDGYPFFVNMFFSLLSSSSSLDGEQIHFARCTRFISEFTLYFVAQYES